MKQAAKIMVCLVGRSCCTGNNSMKLGLYFGIKIKQSEAADSTQRQQEIPRSVKVPSCNRTSDNSPKHFVNKTSIPGSGKKRRLEAKSAEFCRKFSGYGWPETPNSAAKTKLQNQHLPNMG